MSGGWFLLAGLAVAGPDWSEQPAVQLTAMASILEQKSDVSDGFGAGGAFAATLSTPWFITARISGTQTRHFAGSTRPFSWMARGSIGPQLAWRTHNQKRTGTARRDVVVADRGSLNPHLRHTQLVSKASGLTRQHMNSLSVAAGAYNGLGLDAWGDGIRPEIRISYLNWTAPRFIGSGPEAGPPPFASTRSVELGILPGPTPHLIGGIGLAEGLIGMNLEYHLAPKVGHAAYFRLGIHFARAGDVRYL